MKTYISGTSTEVKDSDLSKGYTYPGRIKVGTKDVVMEGSVETYPPNGLRHREDVYEDCQIYVPYTEEELATRNQPSQIDCIEAQATYTAMMTDTLLEV